MKYVMRALVTGKHSFGRKVLHFVTVVAAVMLFLNSPEWGGKCWFGMFLPVLVCCTLTSQKKNKPLFASGNLKTDEQPEVDRGLPSIDEEEKSSSMHKTDSPSRSFLSLF